MAVRGHGVSCGTERKRHSAALSCVWQRKQDRVHDVNAVVVDEMTNEDTAAAATTLQLHPHMHSHWVSALCARGASEAQEDGAAKHLVPTGAAPVAEVTFITFPPGGSLPRLTIDATAEGDDRLESRWKWRRMLNIAITSAPRPAAGLGQDPPWYSENRHYCTAHVSLWFPHRGPFFNYSRFHLSTVLRLFDGTGAQIQDKKSDVGEKRCLWRILEKPGK